LIRFPSAVRRRPALLLGCVAIAALATASVIGAQQPPPAVPATVAVPVAKRITQWDEFSGRFEAVQTVEVRARVSGFIDKIDFRDGQLVKVGDPLFTLDRRSFEIAVESAKAEIGRAEAQVSLQTAEVDRATPLARNKTLTEREFETRRANLLGAQAQLKSAQAALKSAELNLDWTVVRAPIAGRVSDRRIEVGSLVTGGQAGANVLTTIVSLDPIHFLFDVSEADYMRYTRNFLSGTRKSGREVRHPVRVRLADEKDFRHTGVLDFVDNQLNARSGTLRGRAVFDNKEQLFTPGLFGRLQLFGGDADALLIPDSAIVSDQARKIVMVAGADNVVKAAPVTLGTLVDGLRAVTAGLQPTDRVVIDGLANPAVRPGAKIAPQDGTIKAAIN
jgi:membrane fusion protein, multidrug efflux system